MYRQRLYSVEQVRALERHAMAAMDVVGFELMRRAAQASLAIAQRRWPQLHRLRIHCGPGNNGGDGFLLAVLAREAGLQVEVVALSSQSRGDAARARQEWEAAGGRIRVWDNPVDWVAADLEVDALYGIGLDRAPQGPAASLISAINAGAAPVLALDVPSGLNADTGHCPGVVVRADHTVSFIAGKRGLYTGAACDCVGTLELAGLGVPESVHAASPADACLLQPDCLPPRSRSAHKGENGHVLVIGGDSGMAGAARLAGEAALRSGAGLVSVASRAAHVDTINAGRPELMARAVDGPQTLQPLLERADVLALGPGLGREAWGHALWLTALDAGLPLVLDADGLNLLAGEPRTFHSPTVLTPHPGEAARLLGVTTAEIEVDRYTAVRELARRFHCVVVLKGAGSLIADTAGRVAVCPWGNPGMASGGMGDLLTGVVAAFLAQGCSAWQAACIGVGLHARAGDAAASAGERGMLASDLLAPLRALGNDLRVAGSERA